MTEAELNKMILVYTNKIRKDHPEFLKFLNEMPITVPYEENPEINVEALSNYHQSLVSLFKDHQIYTPIDKLPEVVESLPVTQIKTMELDNTYQNLKIEVNNIIISYNDVGEGKVPILFLHGFPFDKSMWKIQMDNLKATNRVIAIDIRGFGESLDETTPLSIDIFGNDIIEFMNKLKIDKAIVCGLSMGGYIALNIIEKFRGRFVGLILCDTQCIADTIEVKENRYKTIEQINTVDASEFNENFINSVFHQDSMINKIEIVENLKKTVLANSKSIIISGLTAIAERLQTCSNLDTIDVPTLIICGREDKITPLVQSQYIQQQIKGSVLKIIDSAGHVSNLEQPDEFNKCIIDFLNSIAINEIHS